MNKSTPIDLKIAKAGEELIVSILNIQTKYELPAFIMELIIGNSLLDIKTCANRELINSIESNNKEEKKDGQ